MTRFAIALAVLAIAAPAHAAELFGGLYAHDIDSPLSRSGVESGADAQLGVRGGRIGQTPLRPYALASFNTAGETHYAAAGISARFGDRLYVQPGLGLAVHSGSTDKFPRTDRITLGSRVLFAPELGVGIRLSDRVSVEASWVHLSHGNAFGRHNPGTDNVGLRLNVGL